jgi:hypothetical protein
MMIGLDPPARLPSASDGEVSFEALDAFLSGSKRCLCRFYCMD